MIVEGFGIFHHDEVAPNVCMLRMYAMHAMHAVYVWMLHMNPFCERTQKTLRTQKNVLMATDSMVFRARGDGTL